MKKIHLFISVCALLSLCAYAQAPKDNAIPVPEFKNQVMLLKSDNTLSDLDKTQLTQKSSISRAGGMVPIVGGIRALKGNKIYLKAEGCCAKHSLSGKPTTTFVVRVEPGTDPENVVGLYAFEAKDDYRKLVTNKVTVGTALGNGNAVGNSKLEGIALQFKRVGEGVYAINYSEQLEAGEYVFLIVNESLGGMDLNAANQQYKKGYCFSVQGKE